jgi:menin
MAGLADLKKHFPLRDISSVVKLFKEQLEVSTEPDLALLSIVVGAVENSLTCSRPLALAPDESGDANIEDDEVRLPAVEFHIVEALYSKFSAIINGSVDLSRHNSKYANRELVKRVSDVIWNSLTRSYYKDRAHLQNLYSYLTGRCNVNISILCTYIGHTIRWGNYLMYCIRF